MLPDGVCSSWILNPNSGCSIPFRWQKRHWPRDCGRGADHRRELTAGLLRVHDRKEAPTWRNPRHWSFRPQTAGWICKVSSKKKYPRKNISLCLFIVQIVRNCLFGQWVYLKPLQSVGVHLFWVKVYNFYLVGADSYNMLDKLLFLRPLVGSDVYKLKFFINSCLRFPFLGCLSLRIAL